MPENADLRFDSLGPGDYDRAKAVLNKAKHPGFVGRESYFQCATNGSCTVAVLNDEDVGVALISKSKLGALSVILSAQGKGIGSALINRMKPRWVNCIGEKIAWFEKLGYQCVGAPKVSQQGKHSTQLMERKSEEEIVKEPIPIIERLAGERGRKTKSHKHTMLIVDYVVRLLNRRQTKSQIKAALNEQFFRASPVNYRTVANYIARARGLIVEATNKSPEQHKNEAYLFYDSVVTEAEADIAIRLRAQERIDKLLGIEVHGKDLPPLEIILASIPGTLADAVRAAIAEAVSTRANPSGPQVESPTP